MAWFLREREITRMLEPLLESKWMREFVPLVELETRCRLKPFPEQEGKDGLELSRSFTRGVHSIPLRTWRGCRGWAFSCS